MACYYNEKLAFSKTKRMLRCAQTKTKSRSTSSVGFGLAKKRYCTCMCVLKRYWVVVQLRSPSLIRFGLAKKGYCTCVCTQTTWLVLQFRSPSSRSDLIWPKNGTVPLFMPTRQTPPRRFHLLFVYFGFCVFCIAC